VPKTVKNENIIKISAERWAARHFGNSVRDMQKIRIGEIKGKTWDQLYKELKEGKDD